MEKKTRSAKKKGLQIRDLSKIAREDLRPDQMYAISGGQVYWCGPEGSGADCTSLTVVKAAVNLTIYLNKSAMRMKAMS